MGQLVCKAYHTKSDALRNLVPFLQFKKREKHPWRSVNFSKVAGLKPVNRTNHATQHKCQVPFYLWRIKLPPKNSKLQRYYNADFRLIQICHIRW